MKRTLLQPSRKLCSVRCFGLRTCTLTVVMLITLTFAPLRSYAQTPNLTGTYSADDGGIYYVQQSGSVLWWAGLSLDSQLAADHQWHRGLSFTNVFRGNINSDNTITGEWADVSRGTTLNSGKLTLAIGNSGGVPQLTRTAVTGGFGGTTWTQTAPLDDTLLNGVTEDIVSRFSSVTKNKGGETLLNPNLRPYRDQTVVYARVVTPHEQYLCNGTFGFVLCSDNPVESEIPHVNYDPPFDPNIPNYPNFGIIDRTFSEFFVANAGDADFDFRLKIDLDKLEPNFYTTGWGDRTSGPKVFSLKLNDTTTHQKLNYASNEAYMGAETIMFGKTTGGGSLLPGWSDANSNSVLVNGRPINGYQLSETHPYCHFSQPCPYLAAETPQQLVANYLAAAAGIALNKLLIAASGDGIVPSDPTKAPGDGIGTYLRITGALILDCGHYVTTRLLGHTCFDDNPDSDPSFVSLHQNQEIHPVYSIDIINSPFRPEDDAKINARSNLTGAWGGSDGSTYYIRQIGNTVWWLGMMRDRQPIMRGTAFDIIGMPQVAAAGLLVGSPICPTGTECWEFASVFKGTLTENSDGSATIKGDWAGVPQSSSPGSTGSTGVTFTVKADRKLITPVTLAGLFPPLQKLYEPEDTTPPQSTLTIGTPQYPVGAGQPFVSSATPFTVTATDTDSAVQNIWDRFFAQGTTPPPAYTPIIGSSAVFKVTGSDGTYEVDTYATDNAGNDETSHAQTIVLDNTPPVATISQPAAAQYGHSDVLTLTYSVSDGAGSGVMSFTPKMDGQTAAQFGASLNSGQMIYLESMSLGTHTFSVDSVDNLGNAGTNSVVFSIVVTFASLKQDVTNLVALGCIDNLGQSLIAKMSAAQNLYGKGQIQTAINILAAALYELQAQAGKHISTVCHDPSGRSFNPVQLLMGDTQYLQASLAGQLKPDPILGSVLDSNNFGIDGATVNLLSPARTVVANTTTDATGFYFFPATAGLVLGSGYTVQVTLPTGYNASTPAYQTFTWQGTAVTPSNFVLN